MNENMIRLVLLIIGAIIILGMLWDGLRRKRQRYLAVKEQAPMQNSPEKPIEDLFDIHHDEVEEEDEEAEADDEAADDEFDDDDEEFEDEDGDEEENDEDLFENVEPVLQQPQPKKPNFISIRVMASPSKPFRGYDLLQTFLSNHLDYGDNKLFHRFVDQEKSKKHFTLASLSEPGDFELSKIGKFVSDGLILYMNPNEHNDSLGVFEEMLETAKDLARDLHGKLMSGQNQPWIDETSEEIRRALA